MAFPPHHHLHGFAFHPYDNPDEVAQSQCPPSCHPQIFQGGPFVMPKRSLSFAGMEKYEEDPMNGGDDELSDNESQLGEKKKRLNLEQVKALEKSFEMGNKLEPERKFQLAKALGLQPRQVAIWFQNRRARWKTKQLEKDYDALKKQFDYLKADNENLHAHNKKLRAQLIALKARDSNEINLRNDNDQVSWSNGSENSGDVNLNVSRRSPASSQLSINHLFPLANSARPPSITQLLQNSSRQETQQENFFTAFNNSGEQQQLWAWQEPLANFQHQSHSQSME